ncbi:MAG TPA: Hsp20/alpha crystallin family protein [Bryobacteraceae bacterium]|nr:Hsp20/alpha crystallin family protein [Bryobacteraceae bacterium]
MTLFLLSPARQQQDLWHPAADVYRTSWGWILKFDLAGVCLEDIHVHVAKNAVTVSGVRRDRLVEGGANHYAMEIFYNRFERTIELPGTLEHARLRLDYRDGILFIRISLEETDHE